MSNLDNTQKTLSVVHKELTKKPIVTLDDDYVLCFKEDILDIDEIIPMYKLIYFIEEYAPELIRKKNGVTINSTKLDELLKYGVDDIQEVEEFINIYKNLGIPLKKETLDNFIYGTKKEKIKNSTQFHALDNSIYGKYLFHTFEKKLNNATDIHYKFKLVIQTPISEFKPKHEEYTLIDIKAEINLIDYPLKFYIPSTMNFKDESELEKLIYFTLGYIQNKVSEEKPELLSFKFTITSIESININDIKEGNTSTYVLVMTDIDQNVETPFLSVDKIFINDTYDPINKLEEKLTLVGKDSIKYMDNFYDKLVKRSSSYTYGFDITILKNYTYVKGEKKQLYNATASLKDESGKKCSIGVEYSINSRYPKKMLPVYLDIDTVDTNNRIENEILKNVHNSFNKIFEVNTTMDIDIASNMKEYLKTLPFSKDEAVICYRIAAINVSVEVFSILIYFPVNQLSKFLK